MEHIKKNLFNLFLKKYSFPLKKPIDKLKNSNKLEKNGAEANKNKEK